MARVLIAGCGYVGQALGERLVLQSHDVWGLRRRAAPLPLGIRGIRADLCSASTLEDSLPEKLDTIFYMASPGGREDPHYRAAYVEGLRTLLEVLARQQQSPSRVFFVSSTAVYGQSDGSWVDESSPTEPGHFSGARLLEAERVLADGPFAGTVVRFGGIYGPRRTSLIDRVRQGSAVYRSGQYTNRIHRVDCVGVLEHLMHLERREPLYLGVDSEPAEERAVLEWLSGALGGPPPRKAARDDADGRRPRGNKRCSNARLLGSGYSFVYSNFREGYTALIEASR